MTTSSLSCFAVPDFPLVHPGDDLVELTISCLDKNNIELKNRDVLVYAQKIVSKSENRYVSLPEIVPGEQALDFADKTGKDPRLVQVILQESQRVLKFRENLLITVHKLGLVMANAGIDKSNVDGSGAGKDETVLLLPENPDKSCTAIKQRLDSQYNINAGVIICDSVGRPWRNGTVGLAIGCAGIPTLHDLRGERDLYQRPLETSITGFADQITSTAQLVMGESDEGQPLVIVRGLDWDSVGKGATDLIRDEETDLFL